MGNNAERRSYYSAGQDIHFQMTTPEEEVAYFEMARAGDESARTFLIENHLLFARNEAVKLTRGALPLDEVISAGNEAIMLAIDKFNPAMGFRFTTYLRPYIRGAIAELWKTKYNSAGVLDPSMTSQYSTPMQLLHLKNSADVPDRGDEANNLGKRNLTDWDAPTEDHPGELADLQRFNRQALAKALASLSDTERKIVMDYYFREKTMDEIGKSLTPPVVRERVRQRLGAILEKLRVAMADSVSEVV